MSRLIFIVGGCRSGKTSYCIKLAEKYEKVVYLATAQILDSEMQDRVRKHQEDRPSHWTTVEEPIKIDNRLLELDKSTQIVIIDCLTLYLSNLILMHEASEKPEEKIMHTIQELLRTIKQIDPIVAIISNDTGSGIVPDNQLARQFRDISGFMNQLVAREADEVYKMEVGIPLRLK
ncbi:MAG: bifunctional adenosylcobinamide kinase/adenosylcobinamide-phosphate guanylyltransferase [bacterium]